MLVQDNRMKILFNEQLPIITHRLSEAGLDGFNVAQNGLVCFAVDIISSWMAMLICLSAQ